MKTYRMFAAALAVTLAAVLAGCGGGGDTAAGNDNQRALKTTAPADLVIGVGDGEARTFEIHDGTPPYRVESSDTRVLQAQRVAPDRFRVTGVSGGSATVAVVDALSGRVQVPVTVTGHVGALRLSVESLTLHSGQRAPVIISGGQAPYRAVGGAQEALRLTLAGDMLTVEGLLVSQSEVVVQDSAGRQQTLGVTVVPGAAAFNVSPARQTVSEESNLPIRLVVAGAAPGEVCAQADGALLQVRGPACTTDRTIVLETGSAGSRCVAEDTDVVVTVVDRNGSTGTSTITIRNTSDVPCGSDTDDGGEFTITHLTCAPVNGVDECTISDATAGSFYTYVFSASQAGAEWSFSQLPAWLKQETIGNRAYVTGTPQGRDDQSPGDCGTHGFLVTAAKGGKTVTRKINVAVTGASNGQTCR